VELALSSSDRRTKVTASELLHAICLLMLGIAAKGPTRRRNEELPSVHFDKLYCQLFPAILQLATDVELVNFGSDSCIQCLQLWLLVGVECIPIRT
jgi:hypothetical protein